MSSGDGNDEYKSNYPPTRQQQRQKRLHNSPQRNNYNYYNQHSSSSVHQSTMIDELTRQVIRIPFLVSSLEEVESLKLLVRDNVTDDVGLNASQLCTIFSDLANMLQAYLWPWLEHIQVGTIIGLLLYRSAYY